MTNTSGQTDKGQNNAEKHNVEISRSVKQNPQTTVNNPSRFDDDYEAEQEDSISNDDAKSEKSRRSGS